MNDGCSSPMDDNNAKWYREKQLPVIKQIKESGTRFIVVGSPGVVDADTFRKDPEQAIMYNKTPGALRDIDRELAKEQGVVFADVTLRREIVLLSEDLISRLSVTGVWRHSPRSKSEQPSRDDNEPFGSGSAVYQAMMDVMIKAKAKYGKEYHVGGGDGVHPDRNDHLVMAYAFLKALGCDGKTGTITVDVKGNVATATDGHKVNAVLDGKIEITSERYLYCFYGEPEKNNSTRGVIELFPFNGDLNRFRLIVNNASSDKLKMTWGCTSHVYSAADLAKGINLATNYLDNPFSEILTS